MKGNRTPLREVQETLLSFISADTILVGHELETDLCLLKVTATNFSLMSLLFFSQEIAILFIHCLNRLHKRKKLDF